MRNATPERYFTLFATLASVFFFTVMLGCQGMGSSTVKAATPAPAGDLSVSPASVTFSNVQAGVSQTQAETLTNTGGSSVTITQAPVTGAGFSAGGLNLPLTLAAGQSASFNVVFNSQSSGSASGSISITSNAANSTLSIPLSARSGSVQGQLAVTPATLSLGSVAIGSSATAAGSLAATGGSVTVTSASSNNSAVALSGLALPVTIPAGQSVPFNVTFSPQAGGSTSAALTFATNGSPSQAAVTVSGAGVGGPGQLAVSPAALNLGSVAVGTSGSATESLVVTGGSVTVTKVSSSNSEFAVSGLSLPVTIAAGQSVEFTVSFNPQTTGQTSATLTFASNASSSTTTGVVIGVGTSGQGQLSVTPTALNLGSVTVGTSGTATGSLTATGGSVTITKASSSNSQFALSGLSLPVTIPAGHSAGFTVTFSPQSSGTANGTLTFTSNASSPTTIETLSGTGATSQGQLGIAPTSMNLGSVTIGSSGTATGSLTATGGSVTITKASSSNSQFALGGLSLPVTIQAGHSAAFSVTFSPQATGTANGTLTFTSNASSATTTESVTGTGTQAQGQLGVTPSSLNLGSVTVGSSGTATGNLTATGASVTITKAGSSNSEFALSGVSLPVTIQAGHALQFTVTFSPQSTGTADGTLTFTSNADPSSTVADLTGTGTAAKGQLGASPSTLSLGNVAVGSSGTAKGSLTATGANVTVTSAGSNNSQFTVSGLSLPMTIQAGQSAEFTVTFSPQNKGAASATLTFASNASSSTTTEAATGTGTQATSYSVNLSWNASTSSGVVGYNVFRSTYGSSCGTYSQLNSSVDSSTSYTDNTVVSGQTYCYVTTAVNSSNQQSGYSEAVEATIP